MKRFSDDQLKKIRKGDFSPLADIYHDNLKNCIEELHKYKKFPLHNVEDVFQDAMFELQIQVINGRFINDNVPGFLLTVTKNKLINRHNKDTRNISLDVKKVELYLYNKERNNDLSPEQERKIKMALIALPKLPEHCQILLQKFYIEEKTLTQIMNEMGYRDYNVTKTTKSRCLKKWTNKIKDMFQCFTL